MADLTQKVVGYRYFRDVDGALGSQGHTQWIWGRGVHEATCDKSGGLWSVAGSLMWSWGTAGSSAQQPATYYANPAKVEQPCKVSPGHGCTCGLHAYHAVPEIKRPPFVAPGNDIPAAVLAWGQMEVHSNGFRAQYAELLALGFNDLWPRTVVERIRTIARDYEVDCLPLSQLQAFAEAHGAPVPADLYPQPEEPTARPQTVNPVKAEFLQYYHEFNGPKQKRHRSWKGLLGT